MVNVGGMVMNPSTKFKIKKDFRNDHSSQTFDEYHTFLDKLKPIHL